MKPAVPRTPHPIETRSYVIMRSRVDTTHLPPFTRAVVERVVHASADLDYVTDMSCDEDALERAAQVLAGGTPIVTDAAMVAAGITAREPLCLVGEERTARLASEQRITRSAAAVRLAYGEVGPEAVWAVGCAPTALTEIIAFGVRPALVVGLPVGFVGAAESKQELRASGLPQVSNHTEKGGSPVAAAAVNALLYGPTEHGGAGSGNSEEER